MLETLLIRSPTTKRSTLEAQIEKPYQTHSQYTSVTRRQANDNMAQLYTGLAVCTANDELSNIEGKYQKGQIEKKLV